MKGAILHNHYFSFYNSVNVSISTYALSPKVGRFKCRTHDRYSYTVTQLHTQAHFGV